MSVQFEAISDGNKPPSYKYLLNGKWITARNKPMQILSPIDGDNLGSIQSLSKDEVSEVVKNAAASQGIWASTSLWRRREILLNVAKGLTEQAELFARALVAEVAKPIALARDEVARTVELIQYYADEGIRFTGEIVSGEAWPHFDKTKTALIERVPLGIVVAIPPFNYPINEAASKIVAALMAGNSVILKPPTQGSIVSLYFVQLFVEAGLPAGVLNVVTGSGAVVGEALVCHPAVAAINFTGSTETARRICQLALLKKVVLGLSGKDASLVLSDADLDLASEQVASGSLSFSGQRCTAVKRVLVESKVADEFVVKLKGQIERQFKDGDLFDSKTTFGPVISEGSAQYIQNLIDDALEKGAQLILGGERRGRLIPPTLLDRVQRKMRIAWEEPFGPVVPVMRVRNWEEAVELANESEYGLQSSIFTQDINTAFAIARRLEVGTVQINGKDARGPDHFPFLGVKNSGLGVVQGAKYLLSEMTRLKVTVLNLHGGEV